MATEADQLMTTHPGPFPMDENTLIDIIDRIYECGKTCTACADACLGEDDPKAQAACITSCQNCGEVCITTARALSRVTGFNRDTIRHLVEACEQICRICADECAGHGDGWSTAEDVRTPAATAPMHAARSFRSCRRRSPPTLGRTSDQAGSVLAAGTTEVEAGAGMAVPNRSTSAGTSLGAPLLSLEAAGSRSGRATMSPAVMRGFSEAIRGRWRCFPWSFLQVFPLRSSRRGMSAMFRAPPR